QVPLGDVPQSRAARMDDEDPRAAPGRLAYPQVQDGQLLLGVQSDHEDRLRPFDILVAHGHARRLLLLDLHGNVRRTRATVVEVVRSVRHAGQLRQRVRVLVAEATAGQARHALALRPRGYRAER